ncbi:MAG: hypothetical protein FWB80_11085 [Defluviitaleaceae bacterium]|nr:hypothetical protein [Defluviitaleaceae bacterium]
MKTNIGYTHKDAIRITENKIEVSLITINNGKTPVKSHDLLLDTGAFLTILNKRAAELNGYEIYKEKACTISGFSEKGLLCDLRKIPIAFFCNHKIEDVIIATPHENIQVTEVLGMNILENFTFGLDFSAKEIFTKIRADFASQKPRYKCGAVSILTEDDIISTGGRNGSKKI